MTTPWRQRPPWPDPDLGAAPVTQPGRPNLRHGAYRRHTARGACGRGKESGARCPCRREFSDCTQPHILLQDVREHNEGGIIPLPKVIDLNLMLLPRRRIEIQKYSVYLDQQSDANSNLRKTFLEGEGGWSERKKGMRSALSGEG